MSIDEHTDELAVEVDDSDTGNEDFSLSDDNIDLQIWLQAREGGTNSVYFYKHGKR